MEQKKMTEEKLIYELTDVKRTFKMDDIEVHALRGVNLKVHEGEFIVILGASGSGKTTLLNQLGAIDKPTSGTIKFDGVIVSAYTENERTKFRRDVLGWIFQFHNLIPSLTAVENVMLALELTNVKKDQHARATEALKAVGLEGMENRFPAQLSGGQQQRVAIARALVKKPRIILADEPTGNLDRKTGDHVLQVMRDLCDNEKITFCMVTHDPSFSKEADRLLVMDDGILYEDDKEKLAMYALHTLGE